MLKRPRYLVSVRIPKRYVDAAGFTFVGKVTRYPDALVLRFRRDYGADVEILVTKIKEKKP
jgi:hypothetical protein